MEMTFNEALKDYVAGFGTGISVEKFVVQIYRFLITVASPEMREKICILNNRYLVVNEVRYQFIRRSSAGRWEVKTF